MSDGDDPVAKARALAAKFSARLASGPVVAGGYVNPASYSQPVYSSGSAATGSNDTVLGKRVRAGGEDGGSKRKKIYVPSSQFPDVDFVALLTGPRGQTLAGLEAATGARLSLRGRGSGEGADPSADDADDDLHVLVQADSDDAMEAASSKINDLMYNPEAREKEQQSQQLITMSTALQSPLSREPEKANPNTFSLSSALYANDEGFRMMGARGPPADERYAPARQEEGSKEIEIEQDKVGMVIGRMGETIKQIQSLTGVYINVSREPPLDGRPVRVLTLKGNPQQIAAGEAEVMRVCAAAREFGGGGGGMGGGPSRPGLGFGGGGGGDAEIMQVPAATIGMVIGRGGESIRRAETISGAMIKVQQDDGSTPGMRVIKLIGSADACARARAEIESIVNATREMGGQGLGPPGGGFRGPPGGGYGQGPPPPPGVDGAGPPGGGYGGPPGGGYGGPPRGYGGGGGGGGFGGPGATSVTMMVPNIAVPTILGRGGEIVKTLQKITGTRIQISRDEGSDSREVIISGRPEQCDQAKMEIEQLVRQKEVGGGIVDPRQLGGGGGGGYGPPPGAYGGQGGYGRAPPSQYGGGYGGPPPSHYGGPPPHGGGGYGGPPQGYGGPPPRDAYGYGGSYGGPPGGDRGAPHGGAPPASSQHPPVSSAPAPPAAEEEAPVPPSDPAQFESWWGTLSLPQQQAYYKRYYPEMLASLQPAA